jgi:hypothetical protein
MRARSGGERSGAPIEAIADADETASGADDGGGCSCGGGSGGCDVAARTVPAIGRRRRALPMAAAANAIDVGVNDVETLHVESCISVANGLVHFNDDDDDDDDDDAKSIAGIVWTGCDGRMTLDTRGGGGGVT